MAGPVQLDRLERVTDLVLVLLNTDQPLSLDSIALQVPMSDSRRLTLR